MGVRQRRLHHAIRVALGGLLFVPVVSLSQDQDEEPAELDRISVTGSRIKRPDIESASPLLIIQRDEIERTGLTSVGDLLQDLAIAGSALNTQVNNGGDGSTNLDLRNLGPERVLILLNGRRFISNRFGIVDLNNIPMAVIERIEILKDGASSIYGSDAITGVVNIITRRDFEGMQANAHIGQYHSHNDGEVQSYDLSVGTTSDRGSVFFNASYVQQEPVWAGDRRISAEPQFGTGTAFSSFSTPQGLFFSFALSSNPLTTDPGANVNPNGCMNGMCPGGEGEAAFRPGDFSFGRPGAGTDRFNFAPDNYILTPQERTNIFSQVAYDVTDDVRLTVEASYNNRKSEQQLAPAVMVLGLFIGGGPTRQIGIAADNAFNPFGIEFSPDSFALARRMVETGHRRFTQDVDSYRFGLGFDGSFELAGRYFDWDVNYVFADLARSDIDTGHFNVNRVRQALSGQPCRDDVFGDGCVELNLFGGQGPDREGTITQAMIDYISATLQNSFSNTLTNYTANVTGDLFELPAGPLAFATGYEYRLQEGGFTPDSLRQAGAVLQLNPAVPVQGAFAVDEVYLELAVPVLSGVIAAERLDLSLSSRLSDYETAGETTNSKVGIEWQPIDDVLLRATYSEGFRAPTIQDQFEPKTETSFFLFADPCSVDTDDDGVEDLVPDLPGCSGVPEPIDYTPRNVGIRTRGGNPDLRPESSESVTIGVVYSPEWLDGLDLTIDYYNIELEGTITTVGVETILNLCANTGTVLCDRVGRDPVTGALLTVDNTGVNLGGSEVEGADFLMSYSFPESRWGYFRLLWDGAYQGTHDETVVTSDGGGFAIVNRLGVTRSFGALDASFPRWKSNLNLNWSLGDWEANWGIQYIHGTVEDCGIHPSFGFCNLDLDHDGELDGRRIGGTTYHDVQVSYFLPEFDARLTAGVRNLFDKGPPLSTAVFADSYNGANYRLPGRFPYLRMTIDF